MPNIQFSVDSALLAELGERLIGKPFVALAELVKNSYDADSTKVRIDLDLAKDRIVVSDNGQGMTLEEFDKFWMRVGSIHKLQQRVTRRYRRQMTGSKGVGRLAVQFLSRDLRLETVSENDLARKLVAWVNWDEAVRAGNLTQATVEYKFETSKEGFVRGTTIILSKLKQQWYQYDTEALAAEVWQLRPPSFGAITTPSDSAAAFDIELRSQDAEIIAQFRERLSALEDFWWARLVGRNQNGRVNLTLEFATDESRSVETFEMPRKTLVDGAFELRIYNLVERKPRGIRIGEARDYLRRFGGVRVFDSGFQLPFYGTEDSDWLGIEVEHSHRLEASKLLPAELQERGSLSFLPTMTRILGVVRVDTTQEPELKITITRDRLQENAA